ncbi:hypothetical protein J5N97_006907 [Dioscorea zingiberensis]|uniref:Uncharacterized protein n=1 Tax=Dioscorea zingiberensis TaxID=325984 RepID=A0A9D5DAV3_9LILI|nr:hypothetical protein J5N97_006907 [Dioscorea zingiberensis]
MAEEAPEIPQMIEESKPSEAASAQDMELDPVSGSPGAEDGVDQQVKNGGTKRTRESCEEEENDGDSKKQNVERSLEEERLEKLDDKGGDGDSKESEEGSEGPKTLGPKVFGSSVEMFDYFMNLLHSWSTNLNINEYEHLVLLDLIKKGHPEPDKKIGVGIEAFQIRFHPAWKSRCFFLVRVDGTSDDFSFRKCVDHILPLPDNMKVVPPTSNGSKHHKGGGHRGHGGGRGGHGRGKRGGN